MANDNAIERIERRWAVALPTNFRQMAGAGLIMRGHPNELVLSDTQWLDAEAIAAYADPARSLEQLIPFGRSARRDLWCWYTGWHEGSNELPVILSEAQSTYFSGYAPSFGACVYRLLLEEFSSTWLVGSLGSAPEIEARFRRYVWDIHPYLPGQWIEQLQAIVGGHLTEDADGHFGFIPYEMCEQIVRRDVSFPHLNEEILRSPP